MMHGRVEFVYHASSVVQSAAYRASVDGTLLPAVMEQIFVDNRDFIYHLHWTPPLILIVYSRLDRGVQSPTEMLPSLEKWGDGVAQFNCRSPSGGFVPY